MNRQQKRLLQREAAKAVSRVKKDLSLINQVGAMTGKRPVTISGVIGKPRRNLFLRVAEYVKRLAEEKIAPR